MLEEGGVGWGGVWWGGRRNICNTGFCVRFEAVARICQSVSCVCQADVESCLSTNGTNS